MNPSDLIAIIAIVLIIGAAAAYLIKAKKSGKACVGCPNSGTCGAKKQGNSCCGCADSGKEDPAE